MTEPIASMPQPDYKDRRILLVVFGVFYCAIGVLCLLLFAAMALMTLSPMMAEVGMGNSMMLSSLMYLVGAVWFIWLGIGSMLARRWARALILVSSWIWLVCGVGTVLALAALCAAAYPEIPFLPANLADMPAHMLPFIVVMLVFLLVIYVLLPAVLVLAYGRRNVKRTAEAHDPHIRWTDKCPLPVLAVSLVALMWSAFLPMSAAYNWFFPFFGTFLTGWAGATVSAVVMIVIVYIAWGMYRLKISAWWTALVLYVSFGVSGAVTFAIVPSTEMYEKMGLPEQQLEAMRHMTLPTGWHQGVMVGLWVVFLVGYLFYIRKYFTKTTT
jgi:MFS family permease